jgi:hypothetical protein
LEGKCGFIGGCILPYVLIIVTAAMLVSW